MVPLLSFFSESEHVDAIDWARWVDVSIGLFEKMSTWCSTVRRTREVVSMIYEATKASVYGAEQTCNTEHDFTWDPSAQDTFWDPASWGSLPGFNDFNFDATDFGALGHEHVGFHGTVNQ